MSCVKARGECAVERGLINAFMQVGADAFWLWRQAIVFEKCVATGNIWSECSHAVFVVTELQGPDGTQRVDQVAVVQS